MTFPAQNVLPYIEIEDNYDAPGIVPQFFTYTVRGDMAWLTKHLPSTQEAHSLN